MKPHELYDAKTDITPFSVETICEQIVFLRIFSYEKKYYYYISKKKVFMLAV